MVGGCSACRCRCSVCQTACHGPLMYAHRLTHAMEHWQKSSTKKKKAATKPSKTCSEGLAAQAGPPGDETLSQPQQAVLGAATACSCAFDCRYCMLQYSAVPVGAHQSLVEISLGVQVQRLTVLKSAIN